MGQYAIGPQITQVWTAGSGLVTLANTDIVNTVTIGRSRNLKIGGMDADPIPPLGAVTYDGTKTLYAIAPAGTAGLTVIPGGSSWSPSPSQIAAQIALNPVAVPNITSKVVKNQGPTTPTTFYTFPAAGRLWGGTLSYDMATNNSAGGGTIQGYAAIITGSGITTGLVECNTGGPSSANAVAVPLLGLGFPVASGDTLQIDVNNGVTMGTNGVMRASVVAWVSVP